MGSPTLADAKAMKQFHLPRLPPRPPPRPFASLISTVKARRNIIRNAKMFGLNIMIRYNLLQFVKL